MEEKQEIHPNSLANLAMGRQKGVKDKFTNLKHAFLQTFEELGGIPALTKWGKENPTVYYTLLARLLPAEQKHTGEVDINHNHTVDYAKYGITEEDARQYANSLITKRLAPVTQP